MTVRRVLIWNIEKFGAWNKPAKGDAPCNRTKLLQFPFIAMVANVMQADVIVIQEFRDPGRFYLPDLCTQLNARAAPADWNYDYIGGAIRTARPSITGVAVTGNQIGYTSAANNEGYAVFFRTNVLRAYPAPQKLSRGQNGTATAPGFMRLVLETVPWATNDLLPIPITVPARAPPWGEATFPRSRTATVAPARQLKARRIKPEDWVANWRNTRRPCAMVMCGTGGAPDANLIVYHAPVNSASNFNGTLMAGLARELNSPDGSRSIVGGDFNLTSKPDLANGFHYFTTNNMTTNTLGAAAAGSDGVTLLGNNDFQRSSVQYLHMGPDVLTQPRDQVLLGTNLGAGSTGFVVDLITMLTTAGTPLAGALFGDAGVGAEVKTAAGLPPYSAGVPAPWGMTSGAHGVKNMPGGLTAPWGGGAAAFGSRDLAAVFYNQFISDHLPLYAQVDI